ncbi:MAG: hypothetical protein GX878_04870 [Firmicutes bacterium]|nr:hypothetical protein [Bacillota bacterium]
MNELSKKMKAAQTVEEVLSIAEANGVEITADQAKEFFAKKDTLEMADEELDSVVGGGGQAYLRGKNIIISWSAGTKMNDLWSQMEQFKDAITARGADYELVKNHIKVLAREYLNVANFSFRYYAAIAGQVTIKEDGSMSIA